jgi:hypothetical protein
VLLDLFLEVFSKIFVTLSTFVLEVNIFFTAVTLRRLFVPAHIVVSSG